MSSHGSVTLCLRDLAAGDQEAARVLWQRYGERVLQLARLKLRGTPRQRADEEDVAQSVFSNLCTGALLGQFAGVADRDELWRLLVVITVRKVLNHRKYELRQKRSGAVSAATITVPDHAVAAAIAGLADDGPSPEFAAIMNESCTALLDCLLDPTLQQIAIWKMEGYGNEDIAERLGCVPRTVARKLRLIRGLWLGKGIS